MILIIDNYDSFTFNLAQAISKAGVDVYVKRNDEISADEVLALHPKGIIFSPGPGRPEAAGNMPSILAATAGEIPILGVCLGHQMIGLHFGARVVFASQLVHGKATKVTHDGKTLFRDLSNPFLAGRYHSLGIDESSIPSVLEISARSADGEIMGIRHRSLPVEGVQFHPESILTPEGDKLITNFLSMISGLRVHKRSVIA